MFYLVNDNYALRGYHKLVSKGEENAKLRSVEVAIYFIQSVQNKKESKQKTIEWLLLLVKYDKIKFQNFCVIFNLRHFEPKLASFILF